MPGKFIWILLGVAFIAGAFIYYNKYIETTDVGNTHCPVTGEPVNGKDHYTYKRERHNLCSKKCKRSFAKDPKKYTYQEP